MVGTPWNVVENGDRKCHIKEFGFDSGLGENYLRVLKEWKDFRRMECSY